MFFCSLALTALLLPSPQQPPSEELEQAVVRAFERTHSGWSVDEVLLQDSLRTDFFEQCLLECQTSEQAASLPAADHDAFARALLHVRKQGGRLPKSTRQTDATLLAEQRATAELSEQTIDAVAEIAARRLQDDLGMHTDAILVSSQARTRFDEVAKQLLQTASPTEPASQVATYLIRKSALKLRKTRKLEPELLARVTEWKRTIIDFSVSNLARQLERIPARPGIYVFRDQSGYLYIGQASDLHERLTQHLTQSDRAALASYLENHSDSNIEVELHVFEKGSPGEKLRVRRAYESELIRTRKPRLNLAP